MALTPAEKMRARRERLRAAGKCQVCGVRNAQKNKTVCKPCNERNKRLVKKSRA